MRRITKKLLSGSVRSQSVPSPGTAAVSKQRIYRHASGLHDHCRADLRAIVEVDHVVVLHADAARRRSRADLPRLGRAVDAIKRRAKVKRPRAERIVRATRHMAGYIGNTLDDFRSGCPV